MDDKIQRTLHEISAFLGDRSIPFAVVGGIAVTVRGEPRFTADVDVVVDVDVHTAVEIIDALRESGFDPLVEDPEELVRTSFLLPLLCRESGVPIDLALGLSGFERQLVERAPIETLRELEIPVATAEDLVIMKLLAGRPRDLDDARRIVARQADHMDWHYVQKVARQLGEAVGQEFDRSLRDLRDGP